MMDNNIRQNQSKALEQLTTEMASAVIKHNASVYMIEEEAVIDYGNGIKYNMEDTNKFIMIDFLNPPIKEDWQVYQARARMLYQYFKNIPEEAYAHC